ncbi:PAS domain S-box protein [Natronomonas salina]|uniref:PAS domain-containing sensor histidine kinase n=1 Tax=Natronomonas salina TaxID=1710540 RepID=UPI0015B74551|nr:PAS domain S-box protein [Natronomonas salina]QLD90293.1 PAS domain S-box protein [Natronomonas salina]
MLGAKGMGVRSTSVEQRLAAALPFAPDSVLYFVAGLFAVTGAMATSTGEYDAVSTFLFEGFVNVGLAAFVVGATWLYLGRSELPRSSWWNVVTGYVGGILFIGVLLLWANLPALLSGASLLLLREDFVFFGNLGGLFGFFVGVSRARSEYNQQLRRELEVSNELVESSQEALWMFRDDWSELLYANAAFEEIIGQSIEALEADPTSFMAAVHPDDRDFVREQTRQLSDGEALEYEIRVNPHEEYGRWVWVAAQPIFRDGEQVAISGFARDITDMKERQRRFEAIFNQTYQFTGLMAPDGTLLEANDTALAFGGIDRRDVVGKKIWDAHWFRISEETRERTRADVERAADGEFVRHELEVQGADGTAIIDFSIRPITDDDGEVTLLIPEGREITELKEHEERVVSLHETTRRLFQAETRTEAAEIATAAAAEILDLPVNSIWFHDADTDALEPAAWTAEADEIFGDHPTFQAGEGLAWEVFESGEPELFDDVRSRPEVQNPETEMRSEMILPLDDAGVFIAGSTTTAEFDGRQVSLAKLLATNVDSALERIDKQRELEARQRELEHQIERLDEFAGIVSHDLRNPLSVAKGHLELLEADLDGDSREDVRKIDDALERMSRLIDDLLTLARAGEQLDDVRPVRLDRVVRSAWNAVETDGHDLRVDLDQRVPADESRLAQLFENLFRNAVEHAGEGASITVGALEDGGGFYVADDGPGIPESEREDVFDAGYSTNAEGTGFGLSIVKEIVDAHGWDITATESAGGGARFEVSGVSERA